MRVAAVALIALVVAAGGPTMAATVQSFSFEEVSKLAPVVVVGRVAEIPEYGIERSYPDGTTVVVREHRFQVGEYLKGDGPAELIVQTLGGKFKRQGTSEVLYQIAGGQPQLPEDAAELVLFLTPFGGDNKFMIATAQHGVVRVERESNGDRLVELTFNDREVMPPDVRDRFLRSAAEGHGGPVSARVPVSTLRQLIETACAEKPRRLPGKD